jgi:hypothetical protein
MKWRKLSIVSTASALVANTTVASIYLHDAKVLYGLIFAIIAASQAFVLVVAATATTKPTTRPSSGADNL